MIAQYLGARAIEFLRESNAINSADLWVAPEFLVLI